jgi:site-specific DNA-methyltransferase (adenine-specific)/modification methylase
MRVEQIGTATLYLADNMEVFPIVSGAFDVVVSDPPYGVNFKGKVNFSFKKTEKREGPIYKDDNEFYINVTLPRIKAMIACAPRAVIFSGSAHMWDYPPPADIGGVMLHGSAAPSPWGFRCFQPVLFYGKSPYMENRLGARPTAKAMQAGAGDMGYDVDNDHPCPKPVHYMNWAVEVASLEGHTVFDPFMGSGTTGVACAGLKRKFIGVEIDPHFFDIAVRRITNAQAAAANIEKENKDGWIF